MMKNQKRSTRLFAGLLAVFLCIGSVSAGYTPKESMAAVNSTADLRFIFTTDLHGQLNNIDYETGKAYNIGGLSKAYTLVKNARAEKDENNSFTFDIGDSVYDYSTEFIFSEDQKSVQPIYKGMSKIGYDAIVLGNHDFDYGFDYILNQIEGAGLTDKTVVSNLMDAQSGDHIFHENMIITRKVKTNNGETAEIKLGIIGETIPNLSTKTENYTGILKTEDIVVNTQKQATALKKQGADIIVALVHSGMGVAEPNLMDTNVSYALTKIPELDVILCGHDHNIFPNPDKSTAYYKLPGVDPKTDLVNGKRIVMSNDRGRSIGVVDLNVKINDGTVEIVDTKADIRGVTSATKADETVADQYGDWEEKLYEYSKKVLGTIKSGNEITNFFGLIEDNAALQLVNDAKRSYALKYINTTNTKYKDYPVIASSAYNRYGQNSTSDFVNISGDITESGLASIQTYNGYLALYEINGTQLREWLEWMASIYETQNTKTTWTDATMQSLVNQNNIQSLISEDWITDWSGYRIFDGVEYTIDPSVKPRYDKNGNKINDTKRISKLTYNGKEVTESTKFVLSTDRITKTTDATKGLDKQSIVKGYNRSSTILGDYAEQLGKVGDIKFTADQNMRLSMNTNQKFIVKASKDADTLAKKQDWYQSALGTFGNYNYYIGKFGNTHIDTTAPSVVIAPTVTEMTNKNYPVIVDATDVSGVKTLKYHVGDYDVDSNMWITGTDIKDRTINVFANGIYSIYAEDTLGNKSVTKVKIDNIEKSKLQPPVVNTYTNRKSKISGKAEPNSTIYFVVGTKKYEAPVDSLGRFSYALPNQKSGTVLQAYVVDSMGRESSKRDVKVKRTGPNRPTLTAVKNNAVSITGNINDTASKVFVIITNSKYDINDVYVAKADQELFEASEIYDAKYDIINTKVKITASGKYTITVPAQLPGTKITLYAIDHLKRVSRNRTATVKDAGPNMPQVFDFADVETSVKGKIPEMKADTEYKIVVNADDKEYTGDVDEKGYFTIPIKRLKVGQTIDVYAYEIKDGEELKSAVNEITVESIDDYLIKDVDIVINSMTNKKDKITGTHDPLKEIYIATENETVSLTVDAFGDYSLPLDKRLSANSKVYAFTRFSNGGIVEAQMITVKAAKPDMPYILLDHVTNNTKQIQVVSEEKCKVTLTVGKNNYTSEKPTYNSEIKGYVYDFEIPRTNSGTKISVVASNSVGKSPALSLSIIKAAPDAPSVDELTTESEEITGQVEIIGTDSNNTLNDTVESTGTKVFATIGKKTYEGYIDENGNYTIVIPKQKKSTKIVVWGQNHAGRGPQKSVTVKEVKVDTKSDTITEAKK